MADSNVLTEKTARWAIGILIVLATGIGSFFNLQLSKIIDLQTEGRGIILQLTQESIERIYAREAKCDESLSECVRNCRGTRIEFQDSTLRSDE